MIELTFNVGETRKRITNRELSSSEKYNSLMSSIRVPREFSRRIRKLDFAVFKAQEFRNVILFFPNCFGMYSSSIKRKTAMAFNGVLYKGLHFA